MNFVVVIFSVATSFASAAPAAALRQELYSMCVGAVAAKDPSPIVSKMSRFNQYVSGNTRIEWAFLLRNGNKCNCEGFHSLMGRNGIADQANGPHEWVTATCGGIRYELSPNVNGDQGGALLPIGGARRPCDGYWRDMGLCTHR